MNGWISVKKKLPEEGTDVLVTDGVACMVAKLDNTKTFYFWSNNSFWSNDEVTHWMPLPEPPKD